MTWFMFALLVLAALCLGLRTTAVLIGPRVHPLVRLLVSLAIGGIMTLALLELCRSYDVFELGLGLLASLSPVGLFDVAKWWFRARSRTETGEPGSRRSRAR
jgi:hypothetical protein